MSGTALKWIWSPSARAVTRNGRALDARQLGAPHRQGGLALDLALAADDALAGAADHHPRAGGLREARAELLDGAAVVVRHEHDAQVGAASGERVDDATGDLLLGGGGVGVDREGCGETGHRRHERAGGAGRHGSGWALDPDRSGPRVSVRGLRALETPRWPVFNGPRGRAVLRIRERMGPSARG